MIYEAKLFVALALVATFVTCHAASSLDEAKNAAAAATAAAATAAATAAAVNSSLDLVEADYNGHRLIVPIYEAVVFTEQKRELDAKQFAAIKVKILEIAESVIVKRKGYLGVGKKAWGFIGIFNNLVKEARELSKTDPSPSVKKTFGPEMSKLVEAILKTKTDLTKLTDQEVYERVEVVIGGIDQLVQKSPVGMYLDWNKLTIDDEPLPTYISPVIHWLRHNGYGMIVKVVGIIGGMFKSIGN